MIKGVNFTKELKTEELNDMSCGRNLNSLESNLVEKLKIIYRGRYKMGEIFFRNTPKLKINCSGMNDLWKLMIIAMNVISI